MTGREKIEAAFSVDGTHEIPVVICYESIYVRDHWDQLTSHPWWYQFSPDIETQMLWRRDVIDRTGQDWFLLPTCDSREDRQHISIEVQDGQVFRQDARTDKKEQLHQPKLSGWPLSGGLHSVRCKTLAQTQEEIDKQVSVPDAFDAAAFHASGHHDLAAQLLGEFGARLYPIYHVSSPLWRCYHLWGFEGMMTLIADRPDLVEYASQRFLAQSLRSVQHAVALGARGVWIEECMTDMISPQAFARLNVPLMQQLVEEIRSLGMQSIYYFCGDPSGKWEHLLAIGADALSLEESKKNFEIHIEEVVDKVQGRCVVLGNLDAVGILQDGSEEALHAEVTQQIATGRRNGNRFIMSIGSPVTPSTPVTRVRQYCELTRTVGAMEQI